jgi:phenylalanyl-tRNA synthetase alpha chain
MLENIVVKSDEEENLKKTLETRHDPDSERLKRFLAMPDLSRTQGNPLNELIKRLVALPGFKNFDIIKVPEIVPATVNFDLLNAPPDHPSRSKSDTYYLDDQHILRTQTTVMWYYYLADQKIQEKIKNNEPVGSLSYGKVYRKDEIDRHHMNVFHQIDGWYLVPRNQTNITIQDLEKVLITIARAIFNTDIRYRFNEDSFPFTDPSIEMEIEKDAKWIEVLGAGIVHKNVLRNLGVDPDQYTGWAFGFGLERLAIISMELPDIRLLWSNDERVKKQLKIGNKYKEVSKFPPITRDISFVVDQSFIPNNYFDLIRDLGGDLVEEVALIDKYENSEKFGAGKLSYTFRVTYRSLERTLTNIEVNDLHAKLEERTSQDFMAQIRVT